jgi:AraC-like DNA-binding protein
MPDRSADAVLSAVLGTYQLKADISDSYRYCGEWREPEPDTAWATFHLLASGSCWVASRVLEQPLRLEAGDLIIFPRGASHVLSRAAPEPAPPDTTMLCGDLRFVTGVRNPVLDSLPDCVLIRSRESEARFVQLAELLCFEAAQRSFGNRVVLDKLADALFVMAVRHYLSHAPNQRGLLAALSDPKLARALEAIHESPGADWSVEKLAETACMSRTAFSERFAAVLECSPHQYLTELRMTEVLRLLGDPQQSVALIAEKLGYQSEAAFRRSFKRVHGHGPGAARRGARGA